jgi:hypothetical protein
MKGLRYVPPVMVIDKPANTRFTTWNKDVRLPTAA